MPRIRARRCGHEYAITDRRAHIHGVAAEHLPRANFIWIPYYLTTMESQIRTLVLLFALLALSTAPLARATPKLVRTEGGRG